MGPNTTRLIFTQWTRQLSRWMKDGEELRCLQRCKSRFWIIDFADVVETRTKWPMNEWSSDPKLGR
jgi:hypothetical protein